MPEPAPPPPLDLDSLVDPCTGLLSGIAPVEMNPGDPSVFLTSARLADLTAYGLPAGAGGFGGAGAGLTGEQALLAAVGEAAERYSLAFVPRDTVFASARELARRGTPVAAPGEWALFDPSQYGSLPFAAFDDDIPIAWVAAHELTEDREACVPCCLVYMPYAPRHPDEQVIGYATSTGAAAGRTPADAALRGILEVIERDAFIIVWRNRLACPRIEIDERSSLHPTAVERFQRPGLRYSLYLTTQDLPFCSVFGVLRDESGARPRLTVGGACHPDPVQAVRKTCLELVQGMKWLEYMDDRGAFPVVPGFTNVRQFEDRIRMYGSNDLGTAFDFLSAEDRTVRLSDLGTFDGAVGEPALRHTCRLLGEHGLQVYARDLTPADVRSCGLSVVKVLIPQAQPLEGDFSMEFLGGRRWREVPVRTGRRASPTPLEQRNPFPHPYP